MSEVTIICADYDNIDHAADIVTMLRSYAVDPMGGGKDLKDYTKNNLVSGLKQAGGFSVLAYVDGTPVGLSNCFWGFSTFKAKPLINIHDVAVASGYRGKGIGRKLFDKIENIGREGGACKITLEVLTGNEPAKGLYASLGYGDFTLDPEMGHAVFWQKELVS